MLLLGAYILVTLAAMTWIASDSGTTGVPEHPIGQAETYAAAVYAGRPKPQA